MFTRYSLCATSEELADRFHADVPEGYRPIYNAAPSHLLPVITQDSQKGFSFFYWGTSPAWANKKPVAERIINAHAELFPEKQVLKKRLRERRCLIPADGFYGWKKTGKRSSIPYRFTMKNKNLFAMAGLWDEYEEEDGKFHTFTVVTTAGNEQEPPFSERIPFILKPEHESGWLNVSNEDSLLALVTDGLKTFDYYSVPTLVNSPEINDRRVIMAVPAADQFGNLSLFD